MVGSDPGISLTYHSIERILFKLTDQEKSSWIMISLTLTLISFLSSGLGSGLSILWAPQATITLLGSAPLIRRLVINTISDQSLLGEAVGGGDQDDGVAAQQHGGAPIEAVVGPEEGALPGELVLSGHVPADDPLVALAPAPGRVLQPE